MAASSPPSCSQHPRPQPEAGRNWLARVAQSVLRTLREMNDGQRRLLSARLSYEAYLPDSGSAPGTYPEFLLRTMAVARREPTAAERAAGRRIG
jgi:hypothetical protein